MVDSLMIAAGLALLFFGGEGLVRGAVVLAWGFGLSRFLVSAVVVGFGTSMPEMTVSVGAALKDSPEIALGNVVGSNIANILLIVGIALMICPLLIRDMTVRRDTVMMIAASVVLCGMSFFGSIGFLSGALMLAGLSGYIAWCYRQDRRKSGGKAGQSEGEKPEGVGALSVPVSVLYCAAGLGLLVSGAYLLVEGAISLARGFGLSEAVIGLTIVAVGTSLPELATSVVAAYRRHGDVIVGNILGSNIFNILAILGIAAMVKAVPITGQIAAADIWIMLAVAVLFAAPLWAGVRLGRLAGAGMLAAYAAYTAWLYLGAGA